MRKTTLKESRDWMAIASPAFAVALLACSIGQAQDVRTNYLPGTDFSKYRTYSWVPIGQFGAPDQILDAEIKASIDSELRARGLTKVEGGAPELSQAPELPAPPGFPQAADSTHRPDAAHSADLFIGYQVGVKQERQWTATGMGERFPFSGMDTGMATATSSTINVGTLVLNIYDASTKRLVWTGFATKTINLSKDQGKNQKNLDKVTQKLLKDFPPRGR